MIAYLSGIVKAKGPGSLVLLTGGVGYRVAVSPPLYASVHEGDELEVFTHQHVREDALELYGFKTMEELGLPCAGVLPEVSAAGVRQALAR